MTPEERTVAISAIRLMQGVVYQESDAWEGLLAQRAAVRDHFATVGIDVVIVESEGYAYLTTKVAGDDDEVLPRLKRRRALTYTDSLLLVLLRKRMVQFESAGDIGRLVVTLEEIQDMIGLFLARSSDETKAPRSVETAIGRLTDMGFLRELRGQKDTWEVRRVLKAYVDAQTLGDYAARLAEYAGEGASDE